MQNIAQCGNRFKGDRKMKALAWLLTASVLSLFIRFSYAASDAQSPVTPTQTTQIQNDKPDVQSITPRQLSDKLAKKKQTMLDDSGQILFA